MTNNMGYSQQNGELKIIENKEFLLQSCGIKGIIL